VTEGVDNDDQDEYTGDEEIPALSGDRVDKIQDLFLDGSVNEVVENDEKDERNQSENDGDCGGNLTGRERTIRQYSCIDLLVSP